jgi:hypothetical protein
MFLLTVVLIISEVLATISIVRQTVSSAAEDSATCQSVCLSVCHVGDSGDAKQLHNDSVIASSLTETFNLSATSRQRITAASSI